MGSPRETCVRQTGTLLMALPLNGFTEGDLRQRETCVEVDLRHRRIFTAVLPAVAAGVLYVNC